MATFNLEESIKHGVEQALNEPIHEGLSVLDWAKIGMNSPRWISVKDRLPDNASDVLAYYDSECEIRIAPVNYYKGVWYDCVFNRPLDTLGQQKITHWMPLPEPPKDGDVG